MNTKHFETVYASSSGPREEAGKSVMVAFELEIRPKFKGIDRVSELE